MKTKKHPTEVKNSAAELLIELQKIILHYGQSYKRLHSTNGYVSPVDAENIYYCPLIPSGYAA